MCWQKFILLVCSCNNCLTFHIFSKMPKFQSISIYCWIFHCIQKNNIEKIFLATFCWCNVEENERKSKTSKFSDSQDINLGNSGVAEVSQSVSDLKKILDKKTNFCNLRPFFLDLFEYVFWQMGFFKWRLFHIYFSLVLFSIRITY